MLTYFLSRIYISDTVMYILSTTNNADPPWLTQQAVHIYPVYQLFILRRPLLWPLRGEERDWQ